MDFVNDLAFGLLSGLAYAAVGLVLLAVGYAAIDLITPGRLGQLIYVERNANAAAVVALLDQLGFTAPEVAAAIAGD